MAQDQRSAKEIGALPSTDRYHATVHGTYAPVSEAFGARLETFFVGLCVAIGDIEGKPFSVAKIAAYMRVPRTTVIRGLDRMQRWGLIDRRGPLLHARKEAQFSYRHEANHHGASGGAAHGAPGACKAFVQKVTLDQWVMLKLPTGATLSEQGY